MKVYTLKNAPKKLEKVFGAHGVRDNAILDLRQVKEARLLLPKSRSESSFFRYDGTDYYQWYYRYIYWYPIGPIFKILKEKK